MTNDDNPAPSDADADRWLILFFRMVVAVTMFAFAAAVMPEKWIVEASEALGFEPFPDSPLTFYLARNLSLLYGFVGVGLFAITTDFQRYRPLVRWVALGTMAFGILQLVVDAQSGLPLWWILGESGSTLMGGVFIWILNAHAQSKRATPKQPS